MTSLSSLLRLSGIVVGTTVILAAASCNFKGKSAPTGSDAGPTADAMGPDRDNDGLPDADEVEGGCPSPDNPDSDGDGLSDGDEIELGTDPCNVDSDGDGIPDGDEVEVGTDPTNADDDSCAGASAQASLVRRPADLILMIDTSGSMGGEADALEARINDDLAGVLDSRMVDYKIIIPPDLPPDDGGDNTDPTICIGAPLAPQDCSNIQTPKPINGPRFFHYDTHVNSRDSLVIAVNEFDDVLGDEGANSGAGQILGGWGTLLRPDSLKVFIEISDDDANATYTAASFDSTISSRYSTMYPAEAPLEYVFHSIIGIGANPAGGAWPPSNTVEPSTCGAGAVNNGAVYQELSNNSDGLRFPLCDNDNFNDIFSAIANDVINGVSLPCTFAPVDTGNGTPDPDRTAVVFEPSNGGGLESLNRVNDVGACIDGAYYLNGTDYTLCPATCDRVRMDQGGKVTLIVGCEGPVID